jgi:multidrug efflux system outer membrane protein
MKKLVIILISFSIISCSFAPKYSRPTVDLPASDNETTDNQTVDNKTGAFINKKWWKNFENEKLNKLVEESLKNNDNLMLAYERINEFEAAFRLSRANLYPSINANASAGRFQTSDEASATGNGLLENDYSLSGSAIFEADIFGKLRNRSKAQKALLLAQKNYADTIKLRIISDTISTYFEICSADLQINTLNNIIDNYKRSFNYRKKQYRNGLVNSLIVKQQEAQLNNSYLSLENITGSKKMLENSLSLLLGKEPKEMFNTKSISCTDLPEPLRLPAMLPSKIIENRPDIVSAEENLKAANFEIGVAKAAYFPTISLTGTFGFESYEFSNFMQSSAEFWNIGGNLTTPIFDFGRIKANVKIANSRQKQALINYIYTVKNAFKEIHDAFIQLENIQNKIERQKTLIADYKEILNISIKQYENGMIDYINVIDARRNLENLYLDLISLNKEYLKQQVFLYKAMGII